MINEIYKDYNVSELSRFAEDNQKRYRKLCKIVGEFALGVRLLNLGITLPFNGDRGCVSASVIKDGNIEIVDIRYF